MSDYGYFGNGIEGYAHYIAEADKGGNGGGGKGPPNGKSPKWVWVVIILAIIFTFISELNK